ncbi:MAG: hypothetical protein DI535_22700 [Citrobacter freundii]|nr:MAG: hypothetical protein DI535_22700 [Citrobacter freundii]
MLFLKRRYNIIRSLIFLRLLFYSITSPCQEVPVQVQQQLESLVNANEQETEDDTYLQQMERFSKHPLNINEADEEELSSLGLMSAAQIADFIRYRQMLGKLVSVYELQAVPGWDPELIRQLFPFITISGNEPVTTTLVNRLGEGIHTLLLRLSRVIEQQRGFNAESSGTKYNGSPLRIFARYKYVYKNLLQFGWTGDKDAGEQFFRGKQRPGFDFNSVHLFARKIGIIEALALGDFTVNFGQGLIQWQSLAFGKSGQTISVKRQSPVLKPYNAAGEYNFYRGVGITIRKRFVEYTLFASLRKLSANKDEDSAGAFVTSIITSGYHRTSQEAAGKGILKQVVTGGSVRFKKNALRIGLNVIRHSFSLPVQKRDEPYNLFALNGKKWMNASTDYAFTLQNVHLFGEAAIDKDLNTAFIQGCMVSADPKVDIAIVYRNIQKGYQAMNANAFTENSPPSNERGCYIGFSIRPVYGWKLDVFADFYQFPWLKYLIDAPSYGKDFMMQLTYTPSKQVELQGRAAHSSRLREAPRSGPIDYLVPVSGTHGQLLLNYALTRDFNLRNRMQLLWLHREGIETGFSLCTDVLYKPLAKPYAISSRIQFFETGSYDSRLYGFENDVPYSYSIPAVFGKGFRYYIVVQLKILKKIAVSCRWAQTVYREQNEIGSGLDLIEGNKKSEMKIQCIYTFK